MSPIVSAILAALGGLLAGFACGTVALHRQHERLLVARRRLAAALQRADNAEYLALHDDTTGLPNRRAFLTALDRALVAGQPTGVVLLDLDNFKTVNDTYSHDHGNQVLTTIGLRLTDLPPPVTLAARLSGDEFALLIDGDHAYTRASAHAASKAISGQPIPITGTQTIAMRASVGYALATDGSTARELLHHADLAMYEAKNSGHGVTDTTPPRPPQTRCRDARNQPHKPATTD